MRTVSTASQLTTTAGSTGDLYLALDTVSIYAWKDYVSGAPTADSASYYATANGGETRWVLTAALNSINNLSSKSTPVGADVIAIGDSAASFAGKKVTLAEAGIVKTYITQQATNTRVTGSGPSSLGNYRSYLRAAGTRTYSETNGAPTTGPSASNGYILYVPADYATGDSNNEPSRYEIFIGTNKEPIFEFYSGTGRAGVVFVNPFQNYGGLNVNGGVCTSYDPTSGIARILPIVFNSGDFYTGLDASGGTITTDIYFDIKC